MGYSHGSSTSPSAPPAAQCHCEEAELPIYCSVCRPPSQEEAPYLIAGPGSEWDQRTALQESRVSSLKQGTTPDNPPDLAENHPVIKQPLRWGAQTLSITSCFVKFCATAPFQLGGCLPAAGTMPAPVLLPQLVQHTKGITSSSPSLKAT